MPLDPRIPLQVENRNFAQPLLDLAEKQRVDSLTQSKLAGDAQARTIGDQTIASNNMVNEQAKRELNANEMKAIVMQMESSRRLLEQGNVKNSLAEMMNIRGKLEAAGQDTSGIEKITTLIQSSPEDGTRYLGEAVEAMKPVVEQLFAATGKMPAPTETFTTEVINGVPVQRSSTTGKESESPRLTAASNVEMFEPVLNGNGQPVAQRNMTTGRIVSDPRAESGQDSETFTTMLGENGEVIGQINDITGRVVSDPRAANGSTASATYTTLKDENGNIIAQQNDITGQVSADPRAKKEFAPSDRPNSVQEFEFFGSLAEEDKSTFLALKRSNPSIDLGDRVAILNQANPGGNPLAELAKQLAPTDQPENISAAAAARNGGVNLTPAQKSVDEAFGKDYAEFVAGGGSADSRKQLSQIEEVGTALASGDNLTGPVLGLVPDFITAFTNPESVDVRERFQEVVQRNLRLVLGAQFTEKEGERLISRAYNPRLSEELNGQRVTRLLTQMGQAAAAKSRAAAYFEENGTLQGYQGKLPSINDFNIEDDDNSANTPSVPGTTRVGRFTVEEAN